MKTTAQKIQVYFLMITMFFAIIGIGYHSHFCACSNTTNYSVFDDISCDTLNACSCGMNQEEDSRCQDEESEEETPICNTEYHYDSMDDIFVLSHQFSGIIDLEFAPLTTFIVFVHTEKSIDVPDINKSLDVPRPQEYILLSILKNTSSKEESDPFIS